ncbi:MAG: GntR family transcriptional regulator [Clostridia bacterium]|nr:GntR family transcriptional regulator [Clostridia bacterium]
MEHRNISIADQIFEKLEKDILIGEYSRGEILTESKLSENLGVSRTPIREALRRLEQEHIIEMSSKGIVVVGISKEDIDMIYEMRVRIEGLAARSAVENASEEDIKELRDILSLQEFYTHKEEADNIKNADSDFHKKIYSMSKSVTLRDALTDLHKKVIKFRRASVSNHSRAKNALDEHMSIYNAIAERNADLAESLIVKHVENARNRLKESNN